MGRNIHFGEKTKKMAAKRKTMEQIRSILQQRINGRSIRSIAEQTGLSRNTIRFYLRTIETSGHSLPHALELTDESLATLLARDEPLVSQDARYLDLHARLTAYASELKKRHVTRELLWEEYRQHYPEGYGYTRFCHYLNAHIGTKDVTAIFEHRPGEKLMIDFAGDKLSYIDTQSGELVYCEVFVAVLPFSSYIYAEALPGQKQQHFAQGINNAFLYLGGVPQCVLCDNMKSAVKKANRYEPTFTELTEQLALHYQTTFMATRVRKPRDKATAETSVNVTYKRIYGKLRNIECYSLKELNWHIHKALDELNDRHFKSRNYSRKDVYQQYERDHLQPLPSDIFEVKKSVFAKVQRNYHIILGEDMHQYSVPWRFSGKKAKVVYTDDLVEIYLDYKRIALHERNYRRHGYTTTKDHMPENHRAIYEQKGWDAAYLLKEAEKTGSQTRVAIALVLESRAFPEQTYNACLGILRLCRKYGHNRLEAACTLVLQGPRVNFGIISNILKNNMDKQLSNETAEDFKTVTHENIQGAENYQ
jgi:transposase